jgi:hypothetical protein
VLVSDAFFLSVMCVSLDYFSSLSFSFESDAADSALDSSPVVVLKEIEIPCSSRYIDGRLTRRAKKQPTENFHSSLRSRLFDDRERSSVEVDRRDVSTLRPELVTLRQKRVIRTEIQ